VYCKIEFCLDSVRNSQAIGKYGLIVLLLTSCEPVIQYCNSEEHHLRQGWLFNIQNMFFLHSFNRSIILNKSVLSLILRWELWIWCSWFMCRRYQDLLCTGINNSKSQFFVVSPGLLSQIAVLLTQTKDPGQTSFQSILSCVCTKDHKNNFLGWLIYLNTTKSWTAQLQYTTLCSGILMCSVLVSSCLLQECVSHLYHSLKLLVLKNNTFLLYHVKLRETVCETKGCKQHYVIKY